MGFYEGQEEILVSYYYYNIPVIWGVHSLHGNECYSAINLHGILRNVYVYTWYQRLLP